ncbi:MAG: CRTAC1 family protein [Ardenticatenales bacterium]|nr:CRTAC1 family protein [Ardenticatenales bacterium]
MTAPGSRITRRLVHGVASSAVAAGLLSGCAGRAPTSVAPGPGTPEASAERAPAAEGSPVAAGSLWFEDVTADSGISFQHAPHYSTGKHMPEIQGGGVIVADFDRNGAPDILATNSGAIGAAVRPTDASNGLFLNDGHARFTDASADWGLPSAGYGLGATAGDIDNDGWTDVVLTGYGDATRVLRNTGSAFQDVTAESGIPGDDGYTSSGGFFDADGDGDLDLFLVRYVFYDAATAKPCKAGSTPIYCTPHLFDGMPDQLWRNDGTGRFSEVSAEVGITDDRGKGLAVSIADIDVDGDVDIYVANDLTPNQLWQNDGMGRFKDIAPIAGVALSRDGRAQAGMGADVSDTDGDGTLDIAVSNFTHESTSIFRQGKDSLFDEQADALGVGPSSRMRLKWGTVFFDGDNDGDEDLMVAAGHIYDNAPEVDPALTFAEQNLLYQNTGNGSFVDVSDTAGPALADVQVSRGLAVADFDGDGLLDFVVGNNGGRLQIGRNAAPHAGRWVGLWLEGTSSNRSAIGARVAAEVGATVLRRQVKGADSFESLSDRRIVLGLADGSQVDGLTIRWPDGAEQRLGPFAAGAWYRIVQSEQPSVFVPGERVFLP